MSDGWIEVTGRRSSKRTNNPRNRNLNLRETSSEPDETKVQKNFERITKEIQNVYDNSTPFLSKLLKDLKSKINSNKLIIYALGCGTIENTSMVLAKSCLYQWAVCILLTHFLKPTSVHIFDPVMSKTDYLVWSKLTNHQFKFKKNDYFNEELNSDSLISHSSSHSYSSKHCNIILWMPHCEKFLYKAVLEGILNNQCPLKVCQTLSENEFNTHSQSASEVNQDNESCNQLNESNELDELDHSEQLGETNESLLDKHNKHKFEGSDELVDSNGLLSLENTILVGNSLSEYSLTDLPFKDSFTLSETALLPFDLHPQSFNDTFITTFSKM